jgi:hypothetical protein
LSRPLESHFAPVDGEVSAATDSANATGALRTGITKSTIKGRVVIPSLTAKSSQSASSADTGITACSAKSNTIEQDRPMVNRKDSMSTGTTGSTVSALAAVSTLTTETGRT